MYIASSHREPCVSSITFFATSSTLFADLDQECFCHLRDDPASEQTPTSPLSTSVDPTEATAGEETFHFWTEAIPSCG